MLEIQHKNNILVVDSRLIAEELGIEHRSLLSTLDSHIIDIELAFGSVTFEIALKKDNKGGSQPRVAYLTEDQATFVTTLSRNTNQVIQAKINLVKAFSKAKGALQSINPELLELLSTMTNKMNVLAARTERLDAIDKSTDTKKGIKGIIETEIENCYSDDLSYTVREYLIMKKQSLDYLATMRKRAIGFYKQSCQVEELPKKGNEVLFVGSNIAYLDQALKTVLGLD